MHLILIFTAIILTLVVVTYHLTIKSKKSGEKEENTWGSLMNDFRQKSYQIQSIGELEEYLLVINEKVKLYETDYNFLVAFNGHIRAIRERLKQID